MRRSEAYSLIGRNVRVLNAWGEPTGYLFTLARYDASRQQFTARSVHTRIESKISVEVFTRGLSCNLLRLEDR